MVIRLVQSMIIILHQDNSLNIPPICQGILIIVFANLIISAHGYLIKNLIKIVSSQAAYKLS
jgi:hypothetical protein